MKKNIKEITRCTGCGACEANCPQNIIDIQLDEEGFYKPIVTNEEKCTECKLCLKSCPANIPKPREKVYGSYSVYSRDKNVIETCSSGGIAYEIARYMNSEGAMLCGCEYDLKQKKAIHKIATNMEEYETCKGSKYIQSDTTKVLKEIMIRLKKGENFVFFGTPCQVAAISQMAIRNKVREKIVLVDFFCHGVPSYYLWENYLKFLKEKKNIEELKKVNFRDKNKGWHEFTVTTIDETGKKFSQSLSENNWFFQFFLSNVCLNNACYTCQYRAKTSYADLRIGDLWGEKYSKDRKGISGVLSFSEKGEQIIKAISNRCFVQKEDIEVIIEEQMKKDTPIPAFRKSIIKSLKKHQDFSKIYYRKVIPSKVIKKLKGEK